MYTTICLETAKQLTYGKSQFSYPYWISQPAIYSYGPVIAKQMFIFVRVCGRDTLNPVCGVEGNNDQTLASMLTKLCSQFFGR